MASCTQLATSGCEGRNGEPCICLNKLEKYIYSLVKRIDILKLEKRSNMAGRSEGDKGKKKKLIVTRRMNMARSIGMQASSWEKQ